MAEQGPDSLDYPNGYFPGSLICNLCINIREKEPIPKCLAFKDKPIPLEIWEARNDHSESFPGDHGIQFEENTDL